MRIHYSPEIMDSGYTSDEDLLVEQYCPWDISVPVHDELHINCDAAAYKLFGHVTNRSHTLVFICPCCGVMERDFGVIRLCHRGHIEYIQGEPVEHASPWIRR